MSWKIAAGLIGVVAIASCIGIVLASREKKGLQVGDEYKIDLEANLTTGYRWEAHYDSQKVELVEDWYEEKEHAPGIYGVGGTQFFVFKMIESGTTEIEMVHKRSWETGSIEIKTFTLEIK